MLSGTLKLNGIDTQGTPLLVFHSHIGTTLGEIARNSPGTTAVRTRLRLGLNCAIGWDWEWVLTPRSLHWFNCFRSGLLKLLELLKLHWDCCACAVRREPVWALKAPNSECHRAWKLTCRSWLEPNLLQSKYFYISPTSNDCFSEPFTYF